MSEAESISVSRGSLERMREELEDLKNRGRSEMSERLEQARAHGDIRENAEYDSAKDDQGRMEARIRHLEHLLRHAVVREGTAADVVEPGVIVTIREDGEAATEEYFMASSAEDRVDGIRTVTTTSPLGSAINGRKPGDTAEVDAPGGSFSVEIVAIRPA